MEKWRLSIKILAFHHRLAGRGGVFFLAERPDVAEVVAEIEFIDVAAADAQAGGIDVHAEAEVVGLFFRLLLALRKAQGECHGVGVFQARKGRAAVVVGAEDGLLEDEIGAAGKKGEAFFEIQRTKPLRFQPEIGRYHDFVGGAHQEDQRNDGAAVHGNAGGDFRAGLQERLVRTLAEQTPKMIDRYAQVRAVAHQAFFPTDHSAVGAPDNAGAEIVEVYFVQPDCRRSAKDGAEDGVQLVGERQPAPVQCFLVVGVLQSEMDVSVFIRQDVGVGESGAGGAQRGDAFVGILHRQPEPGAPAVFLPFHRHGCELIAAVRPQPLAAGACADLNTFFDACKSGIQVDAIGEKLGKCVILSKRSGSSEQEGKEQ